VSVGVCVAYVCVCVYVIGGVQEQLDNGWQGGVGFDTHSCVHVCVCVCVCACVCVQ